MTDLRKALADARKRGRERAIKILAGEEMLGAEAFAAMLGASEADVDAMRERGEVLGVGTTELVRFPIWQLDEHTLEPFKALPALQAKLGSAWAVYRFMIQRHGALDGRTGLDALREGDDAAALDVAESIARGDFD